MDTVAWKEATTAALEGCRPAVALGTTAPRYMSLSHAWMWFAPSSMKGAWSSKRSVPICCGVGRASCCIVRAAALVVTPVPTWGRGGSRTNGAQSRALYRWSEADREPPSHVGRARGGMRTVSAVDGEGRPWGTRKETRRSQASLSI